MQSYHRHLCDGGVSSHTLTIRGFQGSETIDEEPTTPDMLHHGVQESEGHGNISVLVTDYYHNNTTEYHSAIQGM